MRVGPCILCVPRVFAPLLHFDGVACLPVNVLGLVPFSPPVVDHLTSPPFRHEPFRHEQKRRPYVGDFSCLFSAGNKKSVSAPEKRDEAFSLWIGCFCVETVACVDLRLGTLDGRREIHC